MKIGIDARAAKWYRGTGIGTYTYQLINNINNLRTNNSYLFFMPEGANLDINFNDNIETKNIKGSGNNSFWEEVNMPNLLENHSISLYHVPQNGIGLPREKKCPFIITLHDVIPYKMPQTVSERYLNIFLNNVPEIIPLCDGIITVSNYSKKDIMNTFGFPENKIFVTYLAPEEMYMPLHKDISKQIIKEKYGIDDDYILYIGGFSPRKNIKGLIEAFSLLPKKLREKNKLVIAGNKGISYDLYKKRAQELNIENDIIFPGFVSLYDMPYLYNAAKLFVYPSYYEGFGLPPVEAMACGIPVIASNSTSISEILEDAAVLINPDNRDELCSAIQNVLLNEKLRKDLIQKGFNKTSKLKWRKTAIDTVNAYKSVLKYAL